VKNVTEKKVELPTFLNIKKKKPIKMKSEKRVGGCKRVKVISLIDLIIIIGRAKSGFRHQSTGMARISVTFPRFFLGKHTTVPRTRYIQGEERE
jgi:hypothetical protein